MVPLCAALLLPSVLIATGDPLGPADCSKVEPSERVDCGHPGITGKECVAVGGCCFNDTGATSTIPACFFSNPPACAPKPCPSHPGKTYCPSDPSAGQCGRPPRLHCPRGRCGPKPPPPPPPAPPFTKKIKVVHVVQSCHLDVGFADTCAGIVNRYFDKFYLSVIETSDNLTKAGGDAQLTFLTHPYLISLYMDCPNYPGLHCPDAVSKAKVAAALKAGTIWLQGFPHSGEPETFDAATLEAALEFSRNVSLPTA